MAKRSAGEPVQAPLIPEHRTTINLPQDLWDRAYHLAGDRHVRVTRIIADALREYLAKHKPEA